MGHAAIDQNKIARLEYELRKVRSEINQVIADCYDCAENASDIGEKRAWKATARMLRHAIANQ